MQHQLGSSEGSISLQKDGEELRCESREPGYKHGKRQEAREPVQ